MQSTNIPSKIPLPFANSAGSGYKNTIPVASQIGITNGKASFTDGFPPLTFQGISSGGVPPFGADFNGILNEITAIQQWQEAGGFFPYDSAFATTIGGYPKGAILQSANGSGLWVSISENNVTNPDAGGAGWESLAFNGSQSISITSADVTLTQLQSAYPILIISGAMTGNHNLILPTVTGEWIVQNDTTGSFTITAKTASGTGVVLAQGQSTYIYCDGANILFSDSAKVSSFNGRTGAISLTATDVDTALGFVPYNSTNPAGYLSSAVTTFNSRSGAVSLNSGDVTTALGYIPYNTSNPNGYVPSSEFGDSLAANGFQKLPGGLIFQWGSVSSVAPGGSVSVTFPISFPTGVLMNPICTMSAWSGPNAQAAQSSPSSITNAGFIFNNLDVDTTINGTWFVIGY